MTKFPGKWNDQLMKERKDDRSSRTRFSLQDCTSKLTSTGHAVSCEARVTRAVERALGIAARGVLSTVVGCRVDTLVDVCSVDNKFGFISHALPKTSD